MHYSITLVSLLMAAAIFVPRWRHLSIYFLIVFYFLIDYANYALRLNDTAGGTLAKSYKEMLLATSTLYVVAFLSQRKFVSRTYIYVILFALFLLLYGAIQNGFTAAALDWRDSALPIVLAFALAASRTLDEKLASRVVAFFSILIFANSVLAIYQYVTFSGSAEDIWRYHFLVEENQRHDASYHERFAAYQVVRDGNLRSSGIFASALQYSYSAAIAGFYFFMRASNYKANGVWRWASYLMASTCIAGVYVSQVRAAIVVLATSFVIYWLCRRGIAKANFNQRRAFLMVLGVAALYFASLFALGTYLDSSVLGRIPQYALLGSELTPLGHGAGAYRGAFDSYYVYGLLTYGVFFGIWIVGAAALYIRTDSSLLLGARHKKTRSFFVFALCSIPPAFLLGVFQHFSGSLYYQVVWILLAVIAYQSKTGLDQPSSNTPF